MGQAPEEVARLVWKFEEGREKFMRPDYNEFTTRQDFINPLFEALGWDVSHNREEVVFEDTIRQRDIFDDRLAEVVGKRPDFAFKIDGDRKFYVEAKKPNEPIEKKKGPAFQVRAYGWSERLPISVLTDFEGLWVYDCRVRPDKDDTSYVSLVEGYPIRYTEYEGKWDEIAALLGREAVAGGSLVRFAEETKTPKGAMTVDKAFLADISTWREALARDINGRNEGLEEWDLNYAVQMIINRIVFLRICEDRGIEPEGRLLAGVRRVGKVQNETGAGSAVAEGYAYRELVSLFREADEKYNSGLFHFVDEKGRSEYADHFTLNLSVGDGVLREIVEHLYYPYPYKFDVIPIEILGQVYEQFLGKVIVRKDEQSREIEIVEKPEVRKAGGVYYTPEYIVDYIVKNVVRESLKGKTANEARKLRILDPACGSGSFLIGAYDYLLAWYLARYTENEPEKWAKKGKNQRIETAGKEADDKGDSRYRLTLEERKRILLNNIYGVDIDRQAVEVTKLSLLLKVVEGKSDGLLQTRFGTGEHRRILPDLGANIKCGNSLIGPDFYTSGQASFLDEEEERRINVFDWKGKDGFPEIMKGGGFDAVIGNPPYIFARELLSPLEKAYFSQKYKTSWEKQNTFMLFMDLLLRLQAGTGLGGYIVPNSWLTIESAHLLRALYVPRLVSIVDLNFAVFDRVSMEPSIFIVSGDPSSVYVTALRASSKKDFLEATAYPVNRSSWSDTGARITFSSPSKLQDILDKVVEASVTIGDRFDVRTGLQAYERGRGTPPQSAEDVRNHIYDSDRWINEHSYRYLNGQDVGRYALRWSGMWMQYGSWLSQPRELAIFQRPRVLLREITAGLPYALNSLFVEETYLNNKSVLSVLRVDNSVDELKCLTALLNSRLISQFYKQRAVKSARTIFPKVVIKNLREFPYPARLTHPAITEFVRLVEGMLELHRRLGEAKTPYEKEGLERRIEATDGEIDRLVYELYGLSEEEIRVVEDSSNDI